MRDLTTFTPTLNRKGLTLLSPYVSPYDTVHLICSNGHEFSSSLQSVTQSNKGNGCRRCSRRVSPETYRERIKILGVEPLEPYTERQIPILHGCLVCGNTWKTKPQMVIMGVPCSVCSKGAYKTVNVNGRQVRLRGFEDAALSWILENTNVNLSQIEFDSEGSVPIIDYRVGNAWHRHRADFWIPALNCLVEVKSASTLGLARNSWRRTPEKIWQQCKLKARYAIKGGYNYRLLLMHQNGKRMPTPDLWYNLTRRQARRAIGIDHLK